MLAQAEYDRLMEDGSDEEILDALSDLRSECDRLRFELGEAVAEIQRHHVDFDRVSVLASAAHDALRSFEGDDPGMRVGDATNKVRAIRNIVG